MICNAEAASVEAVSTEWAGEASFVGVAWAGDRGDFERFIERHGLTFLQLDDAGGMIYDRFEIVTQPAVVVVDTDGEVQTLRGRADGASISALLTELG